MAMIKGKKMKVLGRHRWGGAASTKKKTDSCKKGEQNIFFSHPLRLIKKSFD